MESLLPSEIARLVYGYLIEEKCDAAAQLFLETSEFLKECNIAQKKGRKFNTRVMGLCLVDILNLYTDAVCMIKNYKDEEVLSEAELTKVFRDLRNVLFVDELSDKNASKTVFLRISIPPKKKSSEGSQSSEKKECQEKVVENEESEKKKDQTGLEPSVDGSPGKTAVPNQDDLNMLQTLLDNTTLHERIAENINKAIDSSDIINNPKVEEEKIIETVLHSTEADPIFDELLDMLVAPRTEDTTTPEDTDKENGDPTEERKDLGHSSSKEEETIKRLEAESKLAIEGILANNKKVQQESSVALPSPSNLIPVDKSQIPSHLTGGIKEVSCIPPSPVVSNAVVIPLNSSTPLQQIDASNIPIISFVSPVQPVRVLKKVPTVGNCGGLQSRMRRISPKPESASRSPIIHVQVQNQDFNQETVPSQNVPELLKKPVARTRGGRSRGSRGVRSITPQISKLHDDKINVVFVETKTKVGVKTRSVYKRQQKCVTPQTKGKNELEQEPVTTDQFSKQSHVLSEVINTDESVQKPSQVFQDPLVERLTEEREGYSAITSQESFEKTNEDLHQPRLNEQHSKWALENGVDDENCEDSKESTNITSSTNNSLTTSANIDETSALKNIAASTTEDVIPSNSACIEPSISTNIQPSISTDTVPEPAASTGDKQRSISNDSSKSEIGKKGMFDDGTPEQQAAAAKLKPRISLSTPRRGKHIRVLDFKTPDKNKLEVRKSHTSPKVYSKMKHLDKLDTVKRGILKSPEQNKDLGKKRSWDADLRKYFGADAMDIPTSVGLKRKNSSKKDVKGKKKNCKSKQSDPDETDVEAPPNPSSASRSSNEDLVKQIEKEVKDVISDEDIALNTSANSETLSELDHKLKCAGSSPARSSSYCDMEIEEMDNARLETTQPASSTDPKTSPVTDIPMNESSPCTSAEIDKNVSSELKLFSGKETSTEIKIIASSPKRTPSPVENVSASKENEVQLTIPSPTQNSENTNILEKQAEPKSNHSFSDIFAPTPLKLSMSSSNENSVGQITPTTKLLMTHLGASNTSPVLSPIAHSYSNLESILITEGNRLEKEKALQVVEGITKLNDNVEEPKSTPENILEDLRPAGSNEASNPNEKSVLPEIFITKTANILQTPAKPPTEYTAQGSSVEMTPLTKVLHGETKILPTGLVTPTLPATPKPHAGYRPEGIPVEMTPLTKVLHSETKILSTALVTPTLPVTPKPRDSKSPNKSDSLNELSEEALHNEPFVDKESQSGQKGNLAKGGSMPLLANNQKKQTLLGVTKRITPQAKILNSTKNKYSPLPLNSRVKKCDVLSSSQSGTPEKQPIKVCKTPRVKLLPKNPSDFFKAKSKCERKKLKVNELTSVNLTVKKEIAQVENEQSKPENYSPQKSTEPEEAVDIDKSNEGLNRRRTRRMQTNTPKVKTVKESPTVELNTTRKRRAGLIQKTPPSKKTSKFQLDLLKEEEQVLRECLQNAKAKLFGMDSSDSDSSDECESKEVLNVVASNKSKRKSSSSSIQEQEPVKPQLFTARDRLKKLESVSMLDSSDSSDDSIEVLSSIKNQCEKALREEKVELTSSQQVESKLQLQLQLNNERSRSQQGNATTNEIRKLGSPQKNENSKLPSNVRDKDESCESFPTLYLSEESNMSLVSESHTVKSMKFRKSPSTGSEKLLSKKTTQIISPVGRPDTEKQYLNPSNESYASSSNIAVQNLPSIPRDLIEPVNSVVTRTVKGLDAYETVIHRTPSKQTVLSTQEEQAFSEYLDNYTFSFTLDADGREDLLCKTLRTSPFYTIFEMNSKNSSRTEHRKKLPERLERVETSKSSPPHERSRKRPRSESSDDEHRKFGRFRTISRRGYRGARPRPQPHRRRDFSSPRYHGSPHYRGHSYSFDRKRSRRESIETNESERRKRDEKRPHKKSSNERSDISPHSSKSSHLRQHTSNKVFNESFRSSKSSESDRLLVDHSFRSSESPRDTLDQKKTSAIERTHLKNKRENLFSRKEEREEGELSDSSVLQPIKPSSQLTAAEAKRKEFIALVTDSSRASLLEKIDLDHFLTMLHGEEK